MDADERLTALKKVYADIILNTAKEAAARIMVSERKASRLEQELKNAKEDAIQMLLRLKQMMDFQIREAATVSCSQQKKIDELEAQLQEAEDIVKDLREELRAVEAALEKFPQRKEVKHTVQVNNSPPRESIAFPPSEVQHNSNIDQTNHKTRDFIILYCLSRNQSEVLERKIVLEQVKEIDLAADNLCLTSPSSVRHTNDTAIDENLARMCNSQSTSGEEVMPVGQEKGEVNLPSACTVSKVCNNGEVPGQPLTDRVIKYTFQRKRKRGALIDGSGSSERSHENQKVHVGPVKVNLIGESTPEKIRLEQVACQLISLSDKKWW
ncbi:hypothetical protein SSX86_013836 [Deinandra increscens subsp. villosa]|uniref:Uncharacterized protein n=1 Tax=Deinandra increscens subsp. villosa TaxID=3103831 RepID=A0AAP0D4X2_9ASTR